MLMGGGGEVSIGPRALETLGTPLLQMGYVLFGRSNGSFCFQGRLMVVWRP